MISRHGSLKTLMTGLYYPAFLGSVLFLFVNRLAVIHSFSVFRDLCFYFGLVLIIYLSSAYLGICYSQDVSYTAPVFILDLATAVCIFFAFYFIGYLSPSDPRAIQLNWFYYSAAGIALTDLIWNELVGVRRIKVLLRVLGTIAFGLMLLSALVGWRHQWSNLSAVLGLTVMLGIYFWRVPHG
jgi:hypothetical protein